MTLSHVQFAQHLIDDIAVPELARGYIQLVATLRANDALAAIVRHKGLDAALAGNTDALSGLQKSNKELVTRAEKEAERLMTLEVKAHYPGHAIVGEEHGYTPGSQTRWVFDPVDGTSAMIRMAMAEAFGVDVPQPLPAFGITIAMVDYDEAVLGVVTQLQPKNNTLVAIDSWIGAKGEPTLHNGKPVHLPQEKPALADATLACTVPQVMFNNLQKWGGYQALLEATGKACLTDQNCIGFMELLKPAGIADIAYESDLAYHDAAALLPILEGAGISVSDNKGAKLRFPEQAIGQEFNLLAAQRGLHKYALEHVITGVSEEKNSFYANAGMHQGYAQKFPVTKN